MTNFCRLINIFHFKLIYFTYLFLNLSVFLICLLFICLLFLQAQFSEDEPAFLLDDELDVEDPSDENHDDDDDDDVEGYVLDL